MVSLRSPSRRRARRARALGACRNPGQVLFYDTETRPPSGDIKEVEVGALPDMLTFTHDGSKLLVANEANTYVAADTAYLLPEPRGRSPSSTWRLAPSWPPPDSLASRHRAATPSPYEHRHGLRARVHRGRPGRYRGVRHAAGSQRHRRAGSDDQHVHEDDWSRRQGFQPADGNEIDPQGRNDNVALFRSVAAQKASTCPTASRLTGGTARPISSWPTRATFREDDGTDRAAASPTSARWRHWTDCASPTRTRRPGNLYAAGARSFSIRGRRQPRLRQRYILDRKAQTWGFTTTRRSRDKGVEPEGVALLDLGDRTYAFVALERTSTAPSRSSTSPTPRTVSFVDMIVTDGDLSPEGLAAYKYRGQTLSGHLQRSTRVQRVQQYHALQPRASHADAVRTDSSTTSTTIALRVARSS